MHRWPQRVEQPLAAISREDGPAEERLRRWLDTLITTKHQKRRDDPEMFATYYQLVQEATDIVDQHVATLIDQLTAIVRDGKAEERRRSLSSTTRKRRLGRCFTRRPGSTIRPAPARGTIPANDEQFESVWRLVRTGLSDEKSAP